MRSLSIRLLPAFAFVLPALTLGCGGGDSSTTNSGGDPTGNPSGGGESPSSSSGHHPSGSGTGGASGSTTGSASGTGGDGGGEVGGGGQGGMGQGGMGQGGMGQGGGGCVDACTAGTTICDGNATRSCVEVAGCAVLSDPVACPGAKVCSGGVCADTCTDQCTTGATKCSGDQIQTCAVQASGCKDFSVPEACPTNDTCSGDKCVLACTDKCAVGDKQCSGDGVQTCALQSNGCNDFGSAVACPGDQTCSAGACQACTEGATRCSTGGDVEECLSAHFQLYKSCAFGCAGGSCSTSVSCTPGAHSCDDGAIQICNSSGTAELYSQTCAVACSSGLCTGACTPAATRCNGAKVETCNGAGTAWTTSDTCGNGCDDATAACALAKLDITTNTNMDGEIVVNGPVIVHSGATLNSPTGNLTIRATSITVELGASIAAAPTGTTPDGVPSNVSAYSYSGPGGGYGTKGGSSYYTGGAIFGSATDATVQPGSPGGNNVYTTPALGGLGGGVIRLSASTVTIAGQVTANGAQGNPGAYSSYGGGGGGSGGGILIAGNIITISGTISALGGAGATTGTNPAAGGQGRVKILSGSSVSITGTVNGATTQGLLPPLRITSSTHPDPNRIYNDDFGAAGVTWDRAFPSAQGYYQKTNTTQYQVPTPATAAFDASELVSIDRATFVAGSNFLHVVSIDQSSNVGAVENQFRIQINTTPPPVSSSSHPSQTTWSSNKDAFFSWTLPTGDANTTGVYYVLDHFGTTVPTKSATFLPVSQKNILLSSLANGVWGFHVIAKDQQGYLTKSAGHYVVRIGADPGAGNVLGTVTDGAAPIGTATVSINHGLFGADQTTNASGNYNFNANSIPVGNWEVEVSKTGFQTKVVMISVTAGMSTTANAALSH